MRAPRLPAPRIPAIVGIALAFALVWLLVHTRVIVRMSAQDLALAVVVLGVGLVLVRAWGKRK